MKNKQSTLCLLGTKLAQSLRCQEKSWHLFLCLFTLQKFFVHSTQDKTSRKEEENYAQRILYWNRGRYVLNRIDFGSYSEDFIENYAEVILKRLDLFRDPERITEESKSYRFLTFLDRLSKQFLQLMRRCMT